MKADAMNEKTIQPQDVFVELRALTEALLTRADADYLRRQVDAAIEVMAERGYSPPTPWPDEDFGVAVWGRSRAASEPGEVARLAEEARPLVYQHDADKRFGGRYDVVAAARIKPTTVAQAESNFAAALRPYGLTLMKTAAGYEVAKLGPLTGEAFHPQPKFYTGQQD